MNGRRHRSLAGSILALYAVLVAVAAGVAALAVDLGLDAWTTLLLVAGFGLALGVVLVERWLRPVRGLLQALTEALRSLRSGDFSARLDERRGDELGELARLHNATANLMREERTQIRQRELLLATALDESPVAVLLTNPLDRILYANREARRLLVAGQPLVGTALSVLAERCPPQMRELLEQQQDGVFMVGAENAAAGAQNTATAGRPHPANHQADNQRPSAEPPLTVEFQSAPAATSTRLETYHLQTRRFSLNRQPHRLIMVRRITAELSRQEAEIWKNVIRLLTHELNNSLAPISSLLHSATLLANRPDGATRASEVFPAIRERIAHLVAFLDGYAQFARLPRPQPEVVGWAEFLAETRALIPFDLLADPGELRGFFDPAQLQQVLINLLKNAAEASDGPADIAVRVVEAPDGGQLLSVLDRGRGLAPQTLQGALLPFYSTKRSGSGLGLPLCREIVEAHGGRLAIMAREGGGTVVSCWLPTGPGSTAQPQVAEP